MSSSAEFAVFASTFGVEIWGLSVSSILLGVTIVQGYLYFTRNNDGCFMRSFVSFVLVLDIVATFLLALGMVHNLNNPAIPLPLANLFFAQIIISSGLVFLSQLFYASRIHAAGMHQKARPIALAISLMAVITYALGLTGEGLLIQGPSLQAENIKIIFGVYNGTLILTDTMATVSMCYFLAHSQTSFKSTKSVLNWLFFFSINRGVLVTASTIAWVVTYQAMPSKVYWVPVNLVLSKLHVNTLLAMLNSRSALRSQMDGRVNVIHSSATGTQSGDTLKSSTKLQFASNYPTQVQTSQSYTICDDLGNCTETIELPDAKKVHSIA